MAFIRFSTPAFFFCVLLRSHSDSLMAALMHLFFAFSEHEGQSLLPSIQSQRSNHISGTLGQRMDIVPYLRPMKQPTFEMRLASTMSGPSGVWATSQPMVKDSLAIMEWAFLHISTLSSQAGIFTPEMGMDAPFAVLRDGSIVESVSLIIFSEEPCQTTPVLALMANSLPPAEKGQSATAPSAPMRIQDSRTSGPDLVITVVMRMPQSGGFFGKYWRRKSLFLSFFCTTQSFGLSIAFCRSGSSARSTTLAPTASCSLDGFMKSGRSLG
mmetsp:Transcript_9193/g.23598  ORF Transcript_9193/g.23598 Transcript_9193/m.23598 type:complete len:269 (+) Transcript_9193:288-1094(+)